MRNFEDIANEKKSQEKSHMVQLESEKAFYKKIMQANMSKELELEKSLKKLTIQDKQEAVNKYNDKLKKQQEEDEANTEWSVSRPETREFGSNSMKKRPESKRKKVKPLKTTSLYLTNSLKPSKSKDFDFGRPL